MEIERKFKPSSLPADLDSYPVRIIEQGYLSTDPVLRVRRDGDEYYLTYKGAGLLSREEYNLPLTEDFYRHLLEKADGTVIRKRRVVIPLEGGTEKRSIELDLFDAPFEGLIIAEVEFGSEEEAKAFTPPAWFGEEVTYDPRYHNSWLSSHPGLPE